MNAGDEPPLLTFQWREKERPFWRLFLSLFFTILGAVGFFLFFKVVYPQARHFSTAPQQVFVLDPDGGVTRSILNRTHDEDFLLLSPDSDPTGGEGASDGMFPVFKPSFAGFEMSLMDLPGVQDKRSLPRVFGIGDMPLPPVATVMKARESSSPLVPPGQAVRVVLHGDLVKRELINSSELSAPGLSATELPRFKVCVADSGRITFVLPLENMPDAKQLRVLQTGVSGLRFKPVQGPAVQWGEVSLQWERKEP